MLTKSEPHLEIQKQLHYTYIFNMLFLLCRRFAKKKKSQQTCSSCTDCKVRAGTVAFFCGLAMSSAPHVAVIPGELVLVDGKILKLENERPDQGPLQQLLTIPVVSYCSSTIFLVSRGFEKLGRWDIPKCVQPHLGRIHVIRLLTN